MPAAGLKITVIALTCVARVAGVCVPACAIVGGGTVRHKVVARIHLVCHVRVFKPHPGIEHRHRDLACASANAPGAQRVDRRNKSGIGPAQVPLAYGGRHEQLVRPKIRVVGRGPDVAPLVHHGPLHLGQPGQAAAQLRRRQALALDQLGVRTERAAIRKWNIQARSQGRRMLRRPQHGLAAAPSQRFAQAAVGAEFHNHPCIGRVLHGQALRPGRVALVHRRLASDGKDGKNQRHCQRPLQQPGDDFHCSGLTSGDR